MTNAIEQTKREMYEALKKVNGCFGNTLPMAKLESALEAHLEELRKALVAANQLTVRCAQNSADSFVELERENKDLQRCNDTQRETIVRKDQENVDIALRLGKMTKERDDITLRLHAVDHAYREQQRNGGTSGPVYNDRGASEQADPYTLGYGSLGKCGNPFPINTIERLHWNDGANDARNRLIQSGTRQEEGMRSGSIGCNGQAGYAR